MGAELDREGRAHFRVWAPDAGDVSLRVRRQEAEWEDRRLLRDPRGYWSGVLDGASHGDLYFYRLDGTDMPDPASRFQPDGVRGPSAIVDPLRFPWTDAHWRGIQLQGQVIYELHVGTFTDAGTWRSASDKLSLLRDTGITVVEVMPVSEFPGEFGWGYDGVFPFAPTRLYGGPDDFRAFVDHAHRLGIAVVLDVVYNHLGPDGCVFSRYATRYFTDKYDTEWGDALNFDDAGSEAVREFFATNAAYWIDEFHLDGLRLDATQSIHDSSPDHIVARIVREARAAAGHRSIVLVTENEPQDAGMLRPEEAAGFGLDAAWNDDFHHSAFVALTGHNEAYFSDHWGIPQEFVSAAKYGYLFQGQWYSWQQQPRGRPTDRIPHAAFVNFLENHDQLANGNGGRIRLRTSPGRYRAMTALLLLMPGTPMLFQGQEFGASAPFLYFADHNADLAAKVEEGRRQFVSQFETLASAEMQARLSPPHHRATFERCRLDWGERHVHDAELRLHRDLIALRRSVPAFRPGQPGLVDGAVLGASALLLRYRAARHDDGERLLLVNLGRDLRRGSVAEPLLAPPEHHVWVLEWSSEAPEYGGGGTPEVFHQGLRIPGEAALVFAPRRRDDVGV